MSLNTWSRLRCLLLALAALAAGCAVEVQNSKPSQTLARQALPDGELYIGWRVFQQKCAGCHGTAATGMANAPDLLPRLREMGSHQFASLVLRRYNDILLAAESNPESTTQSPLTEKILQGKEQSLVMPAWQGDPTVTAHIIDLYAYLSARAEGTQGPGRPAR
jgi:cytochrome c5